MELLGLHRAVSPSPFCLALLQRGYIRTASAVPARRRHRSAGSTHAMRLILHPSTIRADFQAYVAEPATSCTLNDINLLVQHPKLQWFRAALLGVRLILDHMFRTLQDTRPPSSLSWQVFSYMHHSPMRGVTKVIIAVLAALPLEGIRLRMTVSNAFVHTAHRRSRFIEHHRPVGLSIVAVSKMRGIQESPRLSLSPHAPY